MAAPVNVDEFLELVRKSGVTDEKRLDAYLQKHRAGIPGDPSLAAKVLIQNGIITNFQAENLLAGKWKRFSIGKYKILEKLGAGGMGQVFLCEHKLMRRRVAVKVLPTAKAKDPASLERFYREAKAVAALDHPNIVHAYDIDQDEDLHFIVMEYVDGSNFQELIKKAGQLDVTRACHYVRQSALALQHAHEKGLVHRDIKPGNILVDRTGVVKILDMGLARFFHDEEDVLTRKYDENVLGTADYLAPEQALDSHTADIRADIYSLGATFYFLLTGHAPFESANAAQKLMAHQFKQPRPVADYRKDVPAEVSAIIARMMAKVPDQRYTTPGELAEALEAFTREAIAPPTDVELPTLSIAATGQTPPAEGGPDTAVTRSDTPNVSAPVKAPSGAKVAPLPRTPRPASVAAAVAPVPVSAPVEEDLSWDDLAKKRPSRDSSDAKKKPKAKQGQGRMVIALVVLLVVIPVLAVCVIGAAIWFFWPDPVVPPPTPNGPSKLEVTKDHTRPNAFRSIQVALKEAKIGSIIELRDDVHEENVVIDATKGGRTSVTIQAAAGKEVLWRAARNDPDTPLIKTHRASQFKLKGTGITLDGSIDAKNRVKELILITGDCPGLIIEDLQMKSFERSAILLMNTTGTADNPIRLRRLTTMSDNTETPRAGIYLDANATMTPTVDEHIAISDCTFRGIDPKNWIRFSNDKVLGVNVSWPGR